MRRGAGCAERSTRPAAGSTPALSSLPAPPTRWVRTRTSGTPSFVSAVCFAVCVTASQHLKVLSMAAAIALVFILLPM